MENFFSVYEYNVVSWSSYLYEFTADALSDLWKITNEAFWYSFDPKNVSIK